MARYIVLYSYNGMLFIIKMSKLELKYQREWLAKTILNKKWVAEYKQFSIISMKHKSAKQFHMCLMISILVKIGFKYVWKWKEKTN